MKISRFLSFIVAVALSAGVFAGPVDEARRLFKSGDYRQVVARMRPAMKRSPRDGNVTYYLGASLYALGDRDECVKPLTVAESRGVADASRILAEMCLDRYDVDGADRHLDKWAEQLKKAKKDTPQSYDNLQARAIKLRNMLERVEKVEVIDTINVPADEFFRFYRLSSAAGRLLAPDAVSRIGAGSGQDELSVAYLPENNSEVLWSAAGDDGRFRLYGADILDDGSIDHAAVLDESLGEGGDAKYPFLMPDGITLYFANNGENSLGGYDIFMTRRSDAEGGGKQYFQPQNLGMPYNTIYNDYMMAIDETTGLGWFASDRAQIPDTVTIYIFAPSQMRVNASPSDPNIGALARLSDISLTQKPDVDYKSLLESKLPAADDRQEPTGPGRMFAVDGGKGKIYYRITDFRNESARAAMLEAVAVEATLRRHLEKEEAMRQAYRRGDRKVAGSIIDSEKETERLRSQFISLRNKALRLEK